MGLLYHISICICLSACTNRLRIIFLIRLLKWKSIHAAAIYPKQVIIFQLTVTYKLWNHHMSHFGRIFGLLRARLSWCQSAEINQEMPHKTSYDWKHASRCSDNVGSRQVKPVLSPPRLEICHYTPFALFLHDDIQHMQVQAPHFTQRINNAGLQIYGLRFGERRTLTCFCLLKGSLMVEFRNWKQKLLRLFSRYQEV